MDPNFSNEPLENYSSGPRPTKLTTLAEVKAHLKKRHKEFNLVFLRALDNQQQSDIKLTLMDSVVKAHDRNCKDNVIIAGVFG